MAINVTLEELLESGAHFGHQSRRWNPRMAQFIFDEREGVHVFDLAKTREQLIEALDVVSKYVKEGKVILFVGTKKQVKERLAEIALSTGQMYVNERWLGGTLTNFDQIMKSIRKLAEMKDKLAKGEYSHFTKKERLLIEREIADLEKSFGGLSSMKARPDLMVVVDIHKETSAVREAKQLKIPTIGIVDSNSNPDLVNYPIPMNDDASRALEFVLGLFEKTILEAKNIGIKETEKKEKSAKPKTKKVKVNAKAAEEEVISLE
jgi:small subunit ribosomal protein S2